MVEKGIQGGTCHLHIDMQKLITNIRKSMIKIKNRNLYELAMLQKLLVHDFEWVKENFLI